jgi:hypothetical protein
MAVTTPNLGLIAWTQPSDPYDSEELAENWIKVDQHDHSSGKGKRIGTAGLSDGAITVAKLAPDVQSLSPDVTYPLLEIDTEETTTSATYTSLTTPDVIPSVDLPNGGLIYVYYRAVAKVSANDASFAPFLGSTQVAQAAGGAAVVSGTTNDASFGVIGNTSASTGLGEVAGAWTSDLTTGQLLTHAAPPLVIFADPGTYDVGIRFKQNTAGTFTAKNRKLAVWTTRF